MARRRRFPRRLIDVIGASSFLRIRAGDSHRFLAIWMVVVEGRVFVRSWTLKERGWNRAFLEDPRGAIVIADRTILVRAVRPRSERLLAAVDRAYREKYTSPGSRKYVLGLSRGRRRASTTELMPR